MLTDEVAQKVLGELFNLTKDITEQTTRVMHAKDVLAVILNEVEKVRAVQETLVAAGKAELETQRVEQVQMFEKGAGTAFKQLSGEFQKTMTASNEMAARSVAKYDEALQASAEKASKTQLSLFGQAMMVVVGGAIGAAFAVLLMAKGIVPMPSVPLTEKQFEALAKGRKLDEVWPQLEKKTQDRINELFNK